MTISKSLGQTFTRVEPFLERQIFSRGQSYVALPRVRNSMQLMINVFVAHSFKTFWRLDVRMYESNTTAKRTTAVGTGACTPEYRANRVQRRAE